MICKKCTRHTITDEQHILLFCPATESVRLGFPEATPPRATLSSLVANISPLRPTKTHFFVSRCLRVYKTAPDVRGVAGTQPMMARTPPVPAETDDLPKVTAQDLVSDRTASIATELEPLPSLHSSQPLISDDINQDITEEYNEVTSRLRPQHTSLSRAHMNCVSNVKFIAACAHDPVSNPGVHAQETSDSEEDILPHDRAFGPRTSSMPPTQPSVDNQTRVDNPYTSSDEDNYHARIWPCVHPNDER